MRLETELENKLHWKQITLETDRAANFKHTVLCNLLQIRITILLLTRFSFFKPKSVKLKYYSKLRLNKIFQSVTKLWCYDSFCDDSLVKSRMILQTN